MVKGPHAGSMHPYFFSCWEFTMDCQIPQRDPGLETITLCFNHDPQQLPTHVFHKVPDTCSCLNITFVRSLHTPVLHMFYRTKHIWNTAWPANFLSLLGYPETTPDKNHKCQMHHLNQPVYFPMEQIPENISSTPQQRRQELVKVVHLFNTFQYT